MDNHDTETVKYQLGWKFTVAEERAMRRAIRSANRFMENYGKGDKPRMIDYNHYINSRPPQEAGDTEIPKEAKSSNLSPGVKKC